MANIRVLDPVCLDSSKELPTGKEILVQMCLSPLVKRHKYRCACGEVRG